jgi:hypothetical protein
VSVPRSGTSTRVLSDAEIERGLRDRAKGTVAVR